MQYYDPLFDDDRAIAEAYLGSTGQPPDQRLAAIDQAAMMSVPDDMTQQPGPPVSMADVPPQMSVAPEPQPVAYTPAPQGEMPAAEPAPQMPSRGELVGAGIIPGDVEAAAWQQFRGSPGRLVEEHEQNLGRTVNRQAPVDRARFEEAVARQGELNAEEGRLAHFSAEDDVDAAHRRKVEQAAQLGQFQMQREEQAQQLERREADYQNLVQESKVDPDVFWTRRNTGEKIMTAIGGFLMGLGGGADQFIRMVEGEREHAQEERDKEVGAARDRLQDFRERTYSPQAADAFEDAVRARIVAEDLRMMSAESAEAGLRIRGEQEAAKMEAYAAERELEAKRAEAGAIAEKIQVVPRHIAGGSAGGYPAVAAYLRKLGYSPEQSAEYMSKVNVPGAGFGLPQGGAKLSPEAELNITKDERDRRVRLPDGTVVWATNKDRADKAQLQINATTELERNYARQRAILAKSGSSISPSDRAEYNQIAQRNTLLLKESEDLGAVTEADAHMVNPITGAGGEKLLSFTATTLRMLDGAEQHAGMRSRNAKAQLYTDAAAMQPLTTDTEQGVGIEVD